MEEEEKLEELKKRVKRIQKKIWEDRVEVAYLKGKLDAYKDI